MMRFGCSDLTAGYGRLNILFDIDVEFTTEKVTAIIGPNGAGKSTLLKALYGLITIAKGSVEIDGRPLGSFKPESMVRRGIGYVPQMMNVFPTLSVQENLEIGTYAVKGPGCLDDVLEIFPDLRSALKRPAGRLSGGQRTMVAVGRAMMSSPKVLLIDEPTAGLAPQLAVLLWRHLRGLAARGISVVVVEQNVRLALDYSDDVYLLASGRNKLHDEAQTLAQREDLEGLFLESGGESYVETSMPAALTEAE